MLWIIIFATGTIGVVYFVEWLLWGLKYVFVHILNRGGIYIDNFGEFGVKAAFFIFITVVGIIFLIIIRKRVYTVEMAEKFKVVKVVKTNKTLFQESGYGVTIEKEDGELIYINCPEYASQIFSHDSDEQAYLEIQTMIEKSPTKLEEILGGWTSKSMKYKINVRRKML